MIQLPTLGGAGDRLWGALLDVADRVTSDWTLVGGQMMLLHGLEHGRVPPRRPGSRRPRSADHLRTVGAGVTIAATGGTYALEQTVRVDVSYRGRTGQVPRPSLPGALVVKAGAASMLGDARDDAYATWSLLIR